MDATKSPSAMATSRCMSGRRLGAVPICLFVSGLGADMLTAFPANVRVMGDRTGIVGLPWGVLR